MYAFVDSDFFQVQNNPPPPPSDSGSSDSEENENVFDTAIREGREESYYNIKFYDIEFFLVNY